jgi:hypothetical protein
MSDALIASKKCFVVATTSRARRGHMKKNPELEHEWFFLVPFWSGSARSFEEVGKRSKINLPESVTFPVIACFHCCTRSEGLS